MEIQLVHPKGNQSWIFIEGLMLKLKLQYFGHLMWRADSLEKTQCWERLKAEGEGDYRGWDGWMASPTQWAWVWASSRCWWWTGKAGVLQSMGSQSQTWLSDWTELVSAAESCTSCKIPFQRNSPCPWLQAPRACQVASSVTLGPWGDLSGPKYPDVQHVKFHFLSVFALVLISWDSWAT